MRLVLETPATWETLREDGARRSLAVPARGTRVTVDVEPLRPRPPHLEELVGETAHAERAGQSVRTSSTGDLETRCGWRCDLTEMVVLDERGVVDARLVAVFRFMSWIGVVIVRAADEATLAAAKPEVMAVLATGRPDFRGPLVALAQFWD